MKSAEKILLIGGSAGSLDVVIKIISLLDQSLKAPVVIVLHRRSSSDTVLVDLLSVKSLNLHVKEADEKERLLNNVIYVAPADYHLLVEKDHTFSLDISDKINYSRPSIDVTFQSIAEAYGPNVTAILLSGANSDGVSGLARIKDLGGKIIVQDPSTALVPYMPQQAINHLQVDLILTDDNIASVLADLGTRF